MDVFYFLFLSCLGLAITAQAQDCNRPPAVPNMVLVEDGETFPDGSKVTYQCETGYITSGGNGKITCTAGTWSRLTLQCERKSCGSLGEVENGVVDYPEGIQFGDTAEIKCNTGYKLVGRDKIICGVNGWLDRLPVCEALTCDPPPPVVNGNYRPVADVYKYAETIQYTCDQGFTRNGSAAISCSENEKFEPNPPTCVKVECPDPDIKNAQFESGSRPPHGYKATVTYKCNYGFQMTGSGTLVCDINSQWSPGLPTCTKPITPTKPTKPPAPTKPTAPNGGGNHVVTAVVIVLVIIGCCIAGYLIYRRIQRGSGNDITQKVPANEAERVELA